MSVPGRPTFGEWFTQKLRAALDKPIDGWLTNGDLIRIAANWGADRLTIDPQEPDR